MGAPHKRFFWMLVACFGATLLPILALNLVLLGHSLDSHGNTRLASQWQQATRGIVSAPSALDNNYFKSLRLRDRLPEINTVVFGASTTFAVDQDMFPEPLRIYNFSKNGVGLGTMIGEAEYLLEHAGNVKWLVIPLDWSIGFIYQDDAPPRLDLARDPPDAASRQASWLQKIRDALSYPRIAGLFKLLKGVLTAEHKHAAFRQVFLQPASDEYRCPDGARARDFDIQSRGHCRGFRDDGSWTYGGMERVGDARRLITLAASSSSKYAQNLLKTRGVPNPLYLQRLAAVAHRAKERGGGALFIMPPLLGGMEAEFMRHPEWSVYLAKTRQALSAWAERENLALLDAGQSEKFGCTAGEFTDEHHATQSCYRKIFPAFWQNGEKSNATPNRPPRDAAHK